MKEGKVGKKGGRKRRFDLWFRLKEKNFQQKEKVGYGRIVFVGGGQY